MCEERSKLCLTLYILVSLLCTVYGDIHSVLRDLDETEHDQYGKHDTTILNDYRKTIIKEEILGRLGLTNLPNVSNQSFVPTQVLENLLLNEKTGQDEEITSDTNPYYGVTKQVVVLGEPEKRDEMAGMQRVRFHIDYQSHSIISMTLGFRRDPRVLTKQVLKRDGAILFRVLEDDTSSMYRPIRVVNKDHNWIMMNLTDVRNINTKEILGKNITIELMCRFCQGNTTFMWNSDTNRPFLILHLNSESKRRVARSFRCNGNGKSCCLVEYHVDVADIGWNNFVIAPKRIALNYCKGSCGRFPTHSKAENVLIQRLSRPVHRAPFSEPCCVVTKMASVSILYRTGTNIHAIEKKDVPNLKAVECKCSS